MARWRCCWPPRRALVRSRPQCSDLNVSADAPRNVTDFCCGVFRRRLRTASRQPCSSLPECCSAHFSCCLIDVARPQQRLEWPANGTNINYGVRHDVRDRPRASFFHCRCSTCCRCNLLTVSLCACDAQVFDLKQRAICLHSFTDGLLGALQQLWRCVPRAHVVLSVGSLLSSAAVRECAYTCACAPFWRPQRLCSSAIGPQWMYR